MVVAVSIVVTGKDLRPHLDEFIESLDRQSLSTNAFEIAFADLGSTDETLDRLRVLTEHRPNIRMVTATDDTPAGVAGASLEALEHCSGDYVLRLRVDQLLFPQGLERLHDYAVEHDLDAVAGRAVQPGMAVPALLLADTPALPSGLQAAALASPVVLVRRSLATAAADPTTTALPEPLKVGVLTSYPALVQPAEAGGDPAGSDDAGIVLAAEQPDLAWVDDRLVVSVSGSASSSAATDLSQGRPQALLRRVGSDLTYLLDPGDTQLAPR